MVRPPDPPELIGPVENAIETVTGPPFRRAAVPMYDAKPPRPPRRRRHSPSRRTEMIVAIVPTTA